MTESKTLELTQAAVAVMAERLEEATELLRECYHYQNRLPAGCVDRLGAFLTGAPARERPHGDEAERELTETKAALEASEKREARCRNTLGVLRAELAKLQRAWARLELERMTPEAREWFIKGNGTTGDAAVDALIRAGAGYEIGECQNCGAKGPLYSDTLECRWGCSEKGASDGVTR